MVPHTFDALWWAEGPLGDEAVSVFSSESIAIEPDDLVESNSKRLDGVELTLIPDAPDTTDDVDANSS